MEQLRILVTEKIEFENINGSKSKPVFGTFRLLGVYCMDGNKVIYFECSFATVTISFEKLLKVIEPVLAEEKE